jgi:hypothetical protein
MKLPIDDNNPFPRLVFEYGFDEREAQEAKDRGFRNHVYLEFENSVCFQISFYDPIALQQEVERGAATGTPCVAEPGMVVIPVITLDHMRAAARQLILEGFFDSFRPISEQEREHLTHKDLV